jgi:NAD(P)-dependent dehydrogenase (short-subunit alcohol dehydrogenase family)
MTKTSPNRFSLDGRVALVTGASGQLGTEICAALAQEGAIVIGTDAKLDTSSAVKGVEYLTMDITKEKEVEKIFDEVYAKHGRIDLLVNNAGVSCFEPFEKRPEESFDWVMDVNLKGTFHCIRQYARAYDKKKQKQGAIVNIASIYGVVSPDPRIYVDLDRKNSEVYGATKAAVIQMTKYFAVHLAERGIRVNAVSPGGIFNPKSPQGDGFQKEYGKRNPMGRMAEAEEIAGAVIYLGGPAASYVNGQNLVIDGGMSSW